MKQKQIFQGRDSPREKVRKRDNYTCQICLRVWKPGKRRFDVHHLDEKFEGKTGNKYQYNTDMSKLITLCHKCHLNLDSVRKKMSTISIEQYELVKEYRAKRITFQKIGDYLGISKQRAHQIYKKSLTL